MGEFLGKLRWYPGDVPPGIKQQELDEVARESGANLSVKEVKGKDFVTEGNTVYEETMHGSLEEITQTVVTVMADTEQAFRSCVRLLIDRYRAPRTPYSNWGSDERAGEIIVELADAYDGWF